MLLGLTGATPIATPGVLILVLVRLELDGGGSVGAVGVTEGSILGLTVDSDGVDEDGGTLGATPGGATPGVEALVLVVIVLEVDDIVILLLLLVSGTVRSEERRVGKECPV